MHKREQREGKGIDALGILAICVVIAIIVGCVIAQIKIFKTTGWKFTPCESLPVQARSTPTITKIESANARPAEARQNRNSIFNADHFGYVLLNDGTIMTLDSREKDIPRGSTQFGFAEARRVNLSRATRVPSISSTRNS